MGPFNRHINFEPDTFPSYFNECQKNKIHLLYLHSFSIVSHKLKNNLRNHNYLLFYST